MGLFHNPKCRLLSMLCLTFFFFLVEIIVGYFTNSTALIADSFHMLSDVVALVIAYVSVRMSPKKWSKNTFGWARAEVLGALINAVFLLALCFSILIESFKRFVDPERLHNPMLVLVVGVVGLSVNLIGLFLFHDHGHSHGSSGGGHVHVPTQEDANVGEKAPANSNTNNNQKRPSRNMNMHGVFLHVLADALGSVIVIISALIVQYTDWKFNIYVDPALSVIMVVIITHTTLPLLIDSALILLQTVPTHIQIDSLQRKLLEEIDGVLAVHEFHVWQLAGDRIIASAHIRCRNLHDYMQIAEKVKEFFHNEGIHSTTIQPEFVEFDQDNSRAYSNAPGEDGLNYGGQWNSGYGARNRWNDANCALDCPPNQGKDCLQNTCCGPQQRRSPTMYTTGGGGGGELLNEVEIGHGNGLSGGGVIRRNTKRALLGISGINRASDVAQKVQQQQQQSQPTPPQQPLKSTENDLTFQSVKIISDGGGGAQNDLLSSSSIMIQTNETSKLVDGGGSTCSSSSTTLSGSNEKLNPDHDGKY